MSGPSEINKAASFAGGFIQALMSLGEQAAITYAEAQVPWLNFPIIKQVFEYLVKTYGHDLQVVMVNASTSVIIDIQGSIEKADAVNAATALALAQASGDSVAIEKAVQDAIKVYGAGVRWDGVYNAK